MAKGGSAMENAVHTGNLRATLVAMKTRLTTSLLYAGGQRADDEVPEDTVREPVARERTRLGLPRREAEVLPLVARRATNREIAAALVISVRTAEHHVAHILRKLGVANRLEAGAMVNRLAAYM